MKTLAQLQKNLLSIRTELEPLQVVYYEAETEEQEEIIESQLQVLEDKRINVEMELKDCCYKQLLKN